VHFFICPKCNNHANKKLILLKLKSWTVFLLNDNNHRTIFVKSPELMAAWPRLIKGSSTLNIKLVELQDSSEDYSTAALNFLVLHFTCFYPRGGRPVFNFKFKILNLLKGSLLIFFFASFRLYYY
jgi:hypothetical protein